MESSVIEGYYLDGKTSNRVPARLEVLRISESRIRLHWQNTSNIPLSKDYDFLALTITSRLGNTPREISLEDGGLFVTDDNDGVDQLTALYSGKSGTSWLHRIESNLSIALGALVVTLVFCWAMVVYGFPVAAKAIAFQMPEFVERKLGGSLPILDRTFFDPSELPIETQWRIRELVEPYIDAYPSLNAQLEFRGGMGPNAFALPTGQIVFTDEFVKLAENDDELVAVFFHEMGHLEHRHMTRRALQGVMLSLAILFIAGDIESLDMLVGIPTFLADLSYSRDFEREADDYAIALMKKHGVPIQSFADIMSRFQDFYSLNKDSDASEPESDTTESDISSYLSTHPATKERIQTIESHIEK